LQRLSRLFRVQFLSTGGIRSGCHEPRPELSDAIEYLGIWKIEVHVTTSAADMSRDRTRSLERAAPGEGQVRPAKDFPADSQAVDPAHILSSTSGTGGDRRRRLVPRHRPAVACELHNGDWWRERASMRGRGRFGRPRFLRTRFKAKLQGIVAPCAPRDQGRDAPFRIPTRWKADAGSSVHFLVGSGK